MIRLTTAGLALVIGTVILTVTIVAVLTTDVGRLMLVFAVGML